MKIDDVIEIGLHADYYNKRINPQGNHDDEHITIGVTPQTFHEITDAVSSFRNGILYRGSNGFYSEPRLCGYRVKVIEPQGMAARGAWLMIELETEEADK